MQPEKTSAIIKTLINAFTEECLDEIKKGKHPNEGDMFNFGLSSAEAAIRRVKARYEERLNNALNNNNKDGNS
jgi:hypothetical protein